MTKSEKLIQRMRDELGINLSNKTTIERTYAGHWQRKVGAWSWFIFDPNSPAGDNIGSFETVTELLKSKDISCCKDSDICSIEIYSYNTPPEGSV